MKPIRQCTFQTRLLLTFSLDHCLNFAHLLPIRSVFLHLFYIMAKNNEYRHFHSHSLSLSFSRLLLCSLSEHELSLSLALTLCAVYNYHSWLFFLEQNVSSTRDLWRKRVQFSATLHLFVFVLVRSHFTG